MDNNSVNSKSDSIYETKCNCIHNSRTDVGSISAISDVDSLVSVRKKQGKFNNMPIVENDMLAFRNADHLNEYIEYLEELLIFPRKNGATYESQDANNILHAVESKLGFTSLRNTSNAAFQKLNEIGWETLEDIPEKHFITDIVTKSFLSPRASVKYGNLITHFVNKNIAVSISSSDLALLAKLHSLNPTVAIEELNKLKKEATGIFEIERLNRVSVVKDVNLPEGISGQIKGGSC